MYTLGNSSMLFKKYSPCCFNVHQVHQMIHFFREDYMNWQGPNVNIRKGPQTLQKGPNLSLLGTKKYQPRGSNPELRKGPKLGLAKGSIFSQLKNVSIGESRGK